jgi:hypothetical protein
MKKSAHRRLSRLERRPWTLALVSAVGLTLLVPSALALYGPPDLLDTAVALGDLRLGLGLLAFFAGSAGVLRLLLRRRRLPEEQLDEEPAALPKEAPARADQEIAGAARAHLR